MKRLVLFLIAFFSLSLSAHAVLKEKDLPKTLAVLRSEMEASYLQQQDLVTRFTEENKKQHGIIMDMMQRSNQIGVMLYSQHDSHTFDLAYACQEATSLYQNFKKNYKPFNELMALVDNEIERYTNLIASLEKLPPMTQSARDSMMKKVDMDSLKLIMKLMPKPDSAQMAKMKDFMLDEQGQDDRAACLIYANAMLSSYKDFQESLKAEIYYYEMAEGRLKESYDYAENCYKTLQTKIFIDGSNSFPSILKDFSLNASKAKSSIINKYTDNKVERMQSEWSGSIIFGLIAFVLFYMFISIGLGILLVKFILPKKIWTLEMFKDKEKYCAVVIGVFLFAIVQMGLKTFIYHNFIMMACKLLIEFAWLVGVILTSMIFRIDDKDKLKASFKVNLPTILMGLMVICFRIIFIPDHVINLLFPIILVVFVVWQFVVVYKYRNVLETTEKTFGWLTFFVMLVSLIVSWNGFTFLSVQVFIWWIFQLTCVLTVISVYDFLTDYEFKVVPDKIIKINIATATSKIAECESTIEELKAEDKIDYSRLIADKEKELNRWKNNLNKYNQPGYKVDFFNAEERNVHIDSTWYIDLIRLCIVPIAAALSLFYSIYWAADMFNLSEFCKTIYFDNFINKPDLIQVSVYKIMVAAVLFFIFRFFNFIIRAFYSRHCWLNNVQNSDSNISMVNNLSTLVVWGAYILILLSIFQVPKSGISIFTAGLATGIGFAMKTLLENFFYGISLMRGALRKGEWIECDGVKGVVSNISYQTTQIETLEGYVISFLNSTMLNKNFKNLTKSGNYEFLYFTVSIAYGSNVESARKVIIDTLKQMNRVLVEGHNLIDITREPKVIVSSLADSGVNLYVSLWSDVKNKYWIKGEALERIYNALNENGIEIPFPQCDVHIKPEKN